MNSQEWKQFCRKAWDNEYDYLQIYTFAKIGECGYTNSNCKKTTYIEAIPETKSF